jgi:hypothetical protein
MSETEAEPTKQSAPTKMTVREPSFRVHEGENVGFVDVRDPWHKTFHATGRRHGAPGDSFDRQYNGDGAQD